MFAKFLDKLKIIGVIAIILYVVVAIFWHQQWSAFNDQLVLIFNEVITKFSPAIDWIKKQFK